MHFARDNYYPDVIIFEGANELLEMTSNNREESLRDLLNKYREIDQQ